MALTPEEEAARLKLLAKKFKSSGVETVVCPSFLSLSGAAKILAKSEVMLGAQDTFWHQWGAFTGAVSPAALKEVGCQYVLIGHSERRKFFHETDQEINQKIDVTLDNGLTPVICLGESLDDRRLGKTDFVLIDQLKKALQNIHVIGDNQVVIAYEPIWAIGSGKTIEANELEKVLLLLRQILFETWPKGVVLNNVRLVYGGSVTEETITKLTAIESLAGFLVGGASLDVDEFWSMSQFLNK